MSKPVRVRFAPSPTGKLHIGGARTALFNWAYARHHAGRFILRIEDTDKQRSSAAFESEILEGLRWLGIDWDEGPEVGGDYGPYHQAQRVELHRERAGVLSEAGHAYPCFCTQERLSSLRAEQERRGETTAYDGHCRELDPSQAGRRLAEGEVHVLRFRVPEGQTRFRDHVRGEVTFQNREVDDWIMVRSDGSPTYNFVVVCDDADMGISHVLRGEEHLVNTPKQVLLYRALGLEAPDFGHLPLMLGSDRKKLSKRTGDTALADYQAKGYPKEAIINFLCLQGWALDGETEVFSVGQLVDNFEIKDVSKSGAIFDFDKFLWLAGQYIRSAAVEELAERCAPFVIEAGLAQASELGERRDWYLAAVAAEQERISVYSDLPDRIAYLFADDAGLSYTPEAEKNARKHELGILRDYFAWWTGATAGGLDPDALREGSRAWVKQKGVKFPQLFQPLRCALTGLPGGPDLFTVMQLLGLDSSRLRIERALERLA